MEFWFCQDRAVPFPPYMPLLTQTHKISKHKNSQKEEMKKTTVKKSSDLRVSMVVSSPGAQSNEKHSNPEVPTSAAHKCFKKNPLILTQGSRIHVV
jgi:hypothetical protein